MHCVKVMVQITLLIVKVALLLSMSISLVSCQFQALQQIPGKPEVSATDITPTTTFTPTIAPTATITNVPTAISTITPTMAATPSQTLTPNIIATQTPTLNPLTEFESRLIGWKTYLEETVYNVNTIDGGVCRFQTPQIKRINLDFDPSTMRIEASIDPNTLYLELWGGDVRPPGGQINARFTDTLTRTGPNLWNSIFSPVFLETRESYCTENDIWQTSTWRQSKVWSLEFTSNGFVIHQTSTSISLEPVSCLFDEQILHSSSCDIVYVLQE